MTELPDAIGALTRLEMLELRNNRIAALPDAITRLPALWYLDVRDNPISAMPSGLRAEITVERA